MWHWRIQHYCKIHGGEHWQKNIIKIRHKVVIMISSENFALLLYTSMCDAGNVKSIHLKFLPAVGHNNVPNIGSRPPLCRSIQSAITLPARSCCRLPQYSKDSNLCTLAARKIQQRNYGKRWLHREIKEVLSNFLHLNNYKKLSYNNQFKLLYCNSSSLTSCFLIIIN